MSPRTSFKYVYIPADDTCPMEELTMEIPEGTSFEPPVAAKGRRAKKTAAPAT